jgi:hypothetical protein
MAAESPIEFGAMHQRVVLAAGEGELRNRLFEALGPFSAEAVEVPSARRALELTRQIPVHLLVIRYPLDELTLSEFLREFREGGAASRGAQVVVLAPGRSLGGLRRSAGPGVAVMRSDSDLVSLENTFISFLRRSPRFEENLLVGVRLELATGHVRKMLQLKNISETGMLLQTKTPLEEGTTFAFEFGLPDVKRPIRGRGEVVRVVEPGPEGPRGLGVKIVSFEGDSADLLAEYLKVRRQPPAVKL